jgi:hypothetical protein
MGMTMRATFRSLVPRDGAERQRRGAAKPIRHISEPATEEIQVPVGARERRIRESGGPQDAAHYGCACGYQFSASVGTSVHCPHCGATQAW